MSEQVGASSGVCEHEKFKEQLAVCHDEFLNVAHEITEVTGETFGATELYPYTNVMVGLWWDTCYTQTDASIVLVGLPRSEYGEYQKDPYKFQSSLCYELASSHTGFEEVSICNPEVLSLQVNKVPEDFTVHRDLAVHGQWSKTAVELAEYVLAKTKGKASIDAKIAADKPVWEQ